MRIMGIVAWPVRIPICSHIANTPPYGIPSAIIVGSIPRVPVPGIPMPWIVDIGYTVPIPGIIEMASVETCQTKTIVEIHIVAIGKSLVITLAISQVV
jgi:hypothetical protein